MLLRSRSFGTMQVTMTYLRTNIVQDNTVGSRLDKDYAYIAGFLDGDGSLMLQIKKRTDGKRSYRFMPTVCFYQDSRHDTPFRWIRKVIGIGYISKRNDNMTELRVNGFDQVKKVLENLMPYIRFKKKQARALYKATTILSTSKYTTLDSATLRTLIDLILTIQSENYVTKKKKSKEELLLLFNLTP